MIQQDYQSLANVYWLAFLLSGQREMSVDIALKSLEFGGGISRRDVITNALDGIRDQLIVSAARTKQEKDNCPFVAPLNWSLDAATTKEQIESALLAIDVFPRCALLLTVFEGMNLEDVSIFLSTNKDLVAKGRMRGLQALTRNLAGMDTTSPTPSVEDRQRNLPHRNV